MARRGRHRVEATLFPFLSVLLCAIGALIVVMSGQSLLAVAGGVDQVIAVPASTEDLDPVFVECAEGLVRMHPRGVEVPASALDSGVSAFHQLVDDIARRRDGRYVVLLVRPDGFDAFETCLSYAQESGVRVGKEAVLSGGRIVLRDGGVELEDVR